MLPAGGTLFEEGFQPFARVARPEEATEVDRLDGAERGRERPVGAPQDGPARERGRGARERSDTAGAQADRRVEIDRGDDLAHEAEAQGPLRRQRLAPEDRLGGSPPAREARQE